jgi:hypothetical protein
LAVCKLRSLLIGASVTLLLSCQIEIPPKLDPMPVAELLGTFRSNTSPNATLTILPNGTYVHEFEFAGKTFVDTSKWQFDKSTADGIGAIHLEKMRCFAWYNLDTNMESGVSVLFARYHGKSLIIFRLHSEGGDYYFEKQNQS